MTTTDPAVSSYMSQISKRRHDAKRATEALRDAMEGGEPHPLFPTAPGEPCPVIDWINLTRFEPGRGPIDCPRVFTANELQSPEDITQMYGGGSYELKGRCSGPSGAPGPIVRTQRHRWDGESLPFVDSPAQDGPIPAPAAGSGPLDQTAMLIAMMQQNAQASREDAARTAQQAQAAADRQMTLIVQMMQMQQAQSAATMQAIVAAFGGNKGPDIAALFAGVGQMQAASMQAFATLMPKGGDAFENVGKVLELAKGVHGEDSLADLLAGVGQAAAGLSQLEAQAKQNQQTGQQQQQPTPNPVGTPEQQQAAAQEQERKSNVRPIRPTRVADSADLENLES